MSSSASCFGVVSSNSPQCYFVLEDSLFHSLDLFSLRKILSLGLILLKAASQLDSSEFMRGRGRAGEKTGSSRKFARNKREGESGAECAERGQRGGEP